MAYMTDVKKLDKIQKKALRITYDKDYRADTMPLFHDIETLPVTELIEKNILKFMQNIHSYRRPKEFKDFWEVSVNEQYYLRNSNRFKIPLVKSVRLSYLPQFKFAEIFNNFPEDFKWILERKDFLLHLEDYYHEKYKYNDCRKKFCKICSFDAWKKRNESFITFPKTLDYLRYKK
jgi:hypothetical protein